MTSTELKPIESELRVIKQQMNIQTMHDLYERHQAALEYHRRQNEHIPNDDCHRRRRNRLTFIVARCKRTVTFAMKHVQISSLTTMHFIDNAAEERRGPWMFIAADHHCFDRRGDAYDKSNAIGACS